MEEVMNKQDIKISVKFGNLLDCPLIGGWDYVCEKYGLNPYLLAEGLAQSDDTTEISLEDAEHIGLIDF
jgi:hypothetical protein